VGLHQTGGGEGYRCAVTSFFYKNASAPRPNQPRRASVLALIEDGEGRLLFERRADAPLWGLIGGGLEHDETLLDGLRREVREETGLEIDGCELFGTFSDPSRVVRYGDGAAVQLVTIAYRAKVSDTSGLRLSPESVDLRFFARDGLPLDQLAAVHRPILERYLSAELPPFLD